MPAFERPARLVGRHVDAVHLDRAGEAGDLPGDERDDVLATRAGDAGETHHLAGADVEVDALHVAPDDAAHTETNDVGAGADGAATALDAMTDHQLDQPIVVEVAHGHRGDVAAVAEHGHLVGDLEDLVEVVRHVQDRHPACLQPTHGSEESLDVGAGK